MRSQDWKPAPAVLDEFKRWLISEKMATAKEVEEAFAAPGSGDFSVLQIRGKVLNTAFGQEARHRAVAQGDKQIAAAMGLFDRAGKLLAQRRARDNKERRAALDG